MMAPLQRLIESLRNELQQYGEMLALLDHQRQTVLYQGADDILHALSTINAQSRVVEKARQIRQEASQALATSLGQPGSASFPQLIPLLPGHLQPLVTALVQENNALLGEIWNRAQRNQGLLQRSVELMKIFIANLGPEDPTLLPLHPPEAVPWPPEAGLSRAIA